MSLIYRYCQSAPIFLWRKDIKQFRFVWEDISYRNILRRFLLVFKRIWISLKESLFLWGMMNWFLSLISLIIASFTSDCSAAAGSIQSITLVMQLGKSSIIRIIINLLLATFQAYNWILMNIWEQTCQVSKHLYELGT